VLCALLLWCCFLQLDSPGLDWAENLASLGPIKFVIAYMVTPPVFKTEFGINVPISTMDGMARIKQLAPFPTQPHGGGLPDTHTATSKLALAIPFSPKQTAKMLETLEMYRDLPADAEVDIILLCSRDEKSLHRALKSTPELLDKLNDLSQVVSGSPVRIVYSMLSEKQGNKGAYGRWLVFFHMLQYLDAAGYSAVMTADVNVWPVRRGWGAALTAHVEDREDWWMRGSTSYAQRYRLDDNMLYRLGDNRVYVFLVSAFNNFNGLRTSVPPMGHGQAISRLYLQLLPNYSIAKQMVGRMHEMSAIVNLEGTGCVTDEQVRKRFPFAFLVHSSQRVGARDTGCKKLPPPK
jgi:hypothetical protein